VGCGVGGGGVKDTVKMGRRDGGGGEGGRVQNGHGIQCSGSEALKGQWHEMGVLLPFHPILVINWDFEDYLIGSWLRETGRGVFY
jgi:hypothetical protein